MSSSYTAVGPPDAPAIVLVHGTRMSRGMWHPQLAALQGGFRVIALDLPGHGALRDRRFDWDEAVEEIARVIDEAAGGRAVVCGLSLGGYLAIDLAARYPERVAGLVISGASAEPSGRVFPVAIRWLARVMDQTSAPRLDRLNRTWFRQRYSPATANAILAGGFRLRGRRSRPVRAHRPGSPGAVRLVSGPQAHPQRPARPAVPARPARLPQGGPRRAGGRPGAGDPPGQSRSAIGLQLGAGPVRRRRLRARPDDAPAV